MEQQGCSSCDYTDLDIVHTDMMHSYISRVEHFFSPPVSRFFPRTVLRLGSSKFFCCHFSFFASPHSATYAIIFCKYVIPIVCMKSCTKQLSISSQPAVVAQHNEYIVVVVVVVH